MTETQEPEFDNINEDAKLIDPYLLHHPSWESVEPMPLDKLLDRMGLKWYHIRLLLVIGSAAVAEGAQIILITVSTILTQNQWRYSDAIQTLLIAASFFGVVAGSFFAGYSADKYGRKKPMLISLIIMTILNAASAFSPNILVYIFMRFFLGIALGFFAPIGFTVVAENVPQAYRGAIIVLANGSLFIGELVACLIAKFSLTSMTEGDWRALILWLTIPFLLAIILNYLYLDESLRYLMVMGRFEEAFELTNKILRVNNDKSFLTLTELQKVRLQSWEHRLEEEVTDSEIASVKALFQKKYRELTISIWFGWFANFFVYYGIIIFLPLTLSELSVREEGQSQDSVGKLKHVDIKRLAISILVEAISTVIAIIGLLIKQLSRQTFLTILFIITGIISFVLIFQISRDWFVVLATASKVLINTCQFYYYIFTLESYPTKNRTTALGVALAFGKSATVLMPFIGFGLAQAYFLAPFALFSFLCFAASFSIARLRKNLEEHDLK